MRINFKVTNMELTPAIQAYAESKIGPLSILLPSDGEPQAFLEIGRTSNHHKQGEDVFRAEIKIKVAGKEFFAEENGGDLYASIDKVKDEIAREIKKEKSRGKTLFVRGARKIKKRIKGMKPWWPFGGKSN